MGDASGQSQTDDDLIRAVAAGRRSALEALYRRHHRQVSLFIRRLVPAQATAEDLANDVFLEVWDKAAAFRHESRVTSWILGIARFKALAWRRRQKETVDSDDETVVALADGADSPEMVAQKTSKAGALARCIQALGAEHRQIIQLVYYHEQTIAECAALLEIPENTVKTRMFNARRKLSALMAEAGLDRGWP